MPDYNPFGKLDVTQHLLDAQQMMVGGLSQAPLQSHTTASELSWEQLRATRDQINRLEQQMMARVRHEVDRQLQEAMAVTGMQTAMNGGPNLYRGVPRIKTECMGFVSDTWRMMQHGWEVEFIPDPYSFSRMLRWYHPDVQRVGAFKIGEMEMRKDPEFWESFTVPMNDLMRPPVLAKKPNEIIVDPSDVNRMLDLILEQQGPKQKELREKYRKERRRNEAMERQVHAEIVSMQEVA